MHLQDKDKTQHQRDKFVKEWDTELLYARRAKRPPSFTRIFIRVFGRFICKFGMMGSFFEFLLFLTIVLIKLATDQLLAPGAPSINVTVIVISLVFAVVYLAQALIKFYFEFYVWMDAIYMKNGILAMLYEKIACLRHDAFS